MAKSEGKLFIGGGGPDYAIPQMLDLKLANRHGLITGATGTGKTVTLQILTEGFSDAGVPVFLTDVKGDLSGLSMPGRADFKLHDAFMKRANTIGYQDYNYRGYPVVFWDLFGEKGHPVRATISEMGPLLVSRMLQLSEAQEGLINIAFRVADEQGLALLDLKDLRALMVWMGQNEKEINLHYGFAATRSIGTIQRKLLMLENDGADHFFGEPALDFADFMRVDADGRGQVNILSADRLMHSPRLYGSFLFWLLSELFELLPEVGDPEKPRLVFFFDEAHLLFDDATPVLLQKIEQVARLIRSKGVGVYFVTQSPGDVPRDVLGQLGNRIQHAMRAFTMIDQRALQFAAQTYRPNARFKTVEAIRDVGVGEAVTSMLEPKGVPGIVERTLIRPPASQLGPIDDRLRARMIADSPMAAKYDTPFDRRSAHEILRERAEAAAREAEAAERAAERAELEEAARAEQEREFARARRYDGRVSRSGRSRRQEPPESLPGSLGRAMTDVLMKELKGTTGRRIIRGILGGLTRGR